MSRRKGTRIRRMAAVLLSAVLITGMLWDAVPVTVLAQETDGQQENTGGNGTEPMADDTKPEEKTETTPAEGTGSGGQEETDPEGQEKPGTTEGDGGTEDGDDLTGQKPGGGTEEKPQEPGGTEEGQPKPGDGAGEEQPKPGDGTEEETEPGTVGGNEAAPQRVMMAAPAPQTDGQRDATFTFKIYGYHPDKFPLELNNVVAIWSKNAEEFIEGEENKKAVTEEGYTCWSYTFRNLDVNTQYEVKEKNALGQMYTIPTGSGTEYERIDYAVNFYDGNELKGVQYVTSGNHAWEDSAPVLTKDDCTFAGWVTADGGKDAFDFKTAITQITNVYASWTTNTPSGDNIASGTDWVLDKDGKLTISSDAGMEDWIANGRNNHSSKVTSAGILDGVTRISGAAFNGCSGMKSITISESVTSIRMWAFNDCSNLTGITIPSKVGEIGNAAFGDCSSLTTVTMLCETPPTVGTDAFYDCKFVTDKSQGIHVLEGKAQTYKEASDNWKKWAAYITDDIPTPPVEKHEHNDVTFTAWTATDSLPDTAGNYYLTEDVTLSAAWNVPGGETNLCLNGKTITQTADKAWAVSIGSGSTLKLYDCGDDGKITREGNGMSAGSVSVGDGAAFYMYGGNISGNISNCPAVYVNKGEFHMSGGRIADNRNSNTGLGDGYVGGGVNVNNGTFRMSGGEISRNSGNDDYRGGVYLCNSGEFYMSGGKISENKNGVYVSHFAAFHMSGGEVSGNTGAYGGGVRILGTMTAGGNIVITGNTGKDGEEKNLFKSGGIRIDASNPLAGSADIGVTTETAPTDGNPVNITRENGADYSWYFHSDNPAYEIINGENNMVQLAVKHTHEADTAWQQDADGHWHSCKNGCEEKLDYAVHTFEENKCKVCGYIKSSTETHEHNDVSFTAWTATDSLPDTAGNYYLTQNVTLADTWDVPGETTLCLNGKTISASGTDEYRVITIPESCTLNLYDCQEAGNITGGKGGGVMNNGAFRIYGGKISGNSCKDASGGGVNNQGLFQMYGGEISGNEAVSDRGGVGGGVYIGDGTFAMYGGKISGNTASTGGGVGSVSVIGSFLTIIYDKPLTIGGGAEIDGNTCDGKENNVCLNDGQIIMIESSNPFSGSAKIGVTAKAAPTDGSPVNITEENGTDYSSFFTSDNADYKIVNSGNNVVQLVAQSQSYTVTVNSGTGGGEYVAGDTVTIRANAPASGKQFDKWVVNNGSVTLASATSSTTTFTMPTEAVSVTATYKNKSGGGSGSGNADGGDNNNGGDADGSDNNNGGDADGGNNNNGGSDNGNGSSGGNGGTGAGTSQTPGAGQPKVKQEKEGNIRKEVRVEGESTLDAAVETPLSQLADIVLTKEEKQKAADGTDIRIVLDVKDASAFVNASDKALVEKALNGSLAKGYTLGQYLDISLYKVVGNSRNIITETNAKVTVTIDVPDSLKNADSTMKRTFAVIRVHEGRTEFLPDLDHNDNTITIETDRFSTYAVVYKDTAGGNSGRQSGNGKPGVVRVSANSDGKNPGGGQDGEPKTGDSTPVELSATLAMIAGFAYLLLYFADRERGMTEETKKELVSRLVGWAKQGGRIRKYLALAAIFALLVYYHSIGKKTEAVQTRTLHFLQSP